MCQEQSHWLKRRKVAAADGAVPLGGDSAPANVGMPQIDITQYTKFGAIMNDVNTKGTPGAEFSPVPG
jgi:hypothetical protein